MKTSVYKTNYLLISGLLIIACGAIAILGQGALFLKAIQAIGIIHIVAGIVTALFSVANKHLKMGFWVFIVQALARFTYGVWMLTSVKTIDDLILATAVFALFFAFLDFIFSLSAFFLGKVNIKFVLFNLLSGIVAGIIGLVLLAEKVSGTNAIYFIGIFMVAGGLLSVSFSQKLKHTVVENGIAKS